MNTDDEVILTLRKICQTLDHFVPEARQEADLSACDAFIWVSEKAQFRAVNKVNYVDISLLKGIESQAKLLEKNTKQFANGFPANNALLWGARGTGKSSLVKAIHNKIKKGAQNRLVLLEIHREDIQSLPQILSLLRDQPYRFLLFCDDLSFNDHDDTYKSLKGLLEGGIEGRPENVLFYATSNRRHLMARNMIDNEESSAIHASEAVEEKVSLSDRFGIWLGFHNCDQNTYIDIVESYAKRYNLNDPSIDIQLEAIEWSITRGARSGRVAWQYIQDLAGRLGKRINN